MRPLDGVGRVGADDHRPAVGGEQADLVAVVHTHVADRVPEQNGRGPADVGVLPAERPPCGVGVGGGVAGRARVEDCAAEAALRQQLNGLGLPVGAADGRPGEEHRRQTVLLERLRRLDVPKGRGGWSAGGKDTAGGRTSAVDGWCGHLLSVVEDGRGPGPNGRHGVKRGEAHLGRRVPVRWESCGCEWWLIRRSVTPRVVRAAAAKKPR